MARTTQSGKIYLACHEAVQAGIAIRLATERGTRFQNWFEDRLASTRLRYERTGVNAFPDFLLTNHPEGYEVKGLAVPGRWRSYDANSRVPGGVMDGRDIYYVFGRYPDPRRVAEEQLKVVDLVICHGSFLNPESPEVSRNRGIPGFGGYGDILVRNRRMYVPPTPYALAEGVDDATTLITPTDVDPGDGLEEAGRLTRVESERRLVRYAVEMGGDQLLAEWEYNPYAGREHEFVAYRALGAGGPVVQLSGHEEVERALQEADAAYDQRERRMPQG